MFDDVNMEIDRVEVIVQFGNFKEIDLIMEYRFFFKKLGLEMEVKIVFDDLVDVLFLLILFFEFLGLIEI